MTMLYVRAPCCRAAAHAEGRAAAEAAALLAGCSRLTPELAAAAASSDGLVLLAAADWSMFELFGVNWLAAVQKAGLDNYLIAALDQVRRGRWGGGGGCQQQELAACMVSCWAALMDSSMHHTLPCDATQHAGGAAEEQFVLASLYRTCLLSVLLHFLVGCHALSLPLCLPPPAACLPARSAPPTSCAPTSWATARCGAAARGRQQRGTGRCPSRRQPTSTPAQHTG